MKTLGITFMNVVQNTSLNLKEQGLLLELFRSYDVDLYATTDSVTGGSFKLAEDTQEDITLLQELLKAGEIFKLDFYQALGDFDLIIMGKCTNNAGGDAIILQKSLIEKYNFPKIA